MNKNSKANRARAAKNANNGNNTTECFIPSTQSGGSVQLRKQVITIGKIDRRSKFPKVAAKRGKINSTDE